MAGVSQTLKEERAPIFLTPGFHRPGLTVMISVYLFWNPKLIIKQFVSILVQSMIQQRPDIRISGTGRALCLSHDYVPISHIVLFFKTAPSFLARQKTVPSHLQTTRKTNATQASLQYHCHGCVFALFYVKPTQLGYRVSIHIRDPLENTGRK